MNDEFYFAFIVYCDSLFIAWFRCSVTYCNRICAPMLIFSIIIKLYKRIAQKTKRVHLKGMNETRQSPL